MDVVGPQPGDLHGDTGPSAAVQRAAIFEDADEMPLPPVSEKRCSLEGNFAIDPEALADPKARVDVVVQDNPEPAAAEMLLAEKLVRRGAPDRSTGSGARGRERGRGRGRGLRGAAEHGTQPSGNEGCGKSPNFTEGEVLKLLDLRASIVMQRR